jgi:hypothetical protein
VKERFQNDNEANATGRSASHIFELLYRGALVLTATEQI